ncbi:MAG: hypothetical protein LBH64_04505, partial [Coriobacteriales bacterium]|nr:hypothetical protein [Coriobacteriales bacterium]
MGKGCGSVRLVLLGSTGSIGRQALDVVRRNPEAVRVVALAAHRNIELLVAQAVEFSVEALAIGDEKAQGHPALAQLPADIKVGFGAAAVEALCALESVDMVLNALVGFAGLRASYNTLAQGRRLALANKESLVVGGDLLMPLALAREEARKTTAPAQADQHRLLPVDSEHSAIFQCLVGERATEVSRIWLTASGGPFRGRRRA